MDLRSFSNMATYNQLFEFDEPIPSIMLHSLKFVDGKWKFVYSIETPVRLKSGVVRKSPLYFKGYINNMVLMSEVKKNMINIPVRSKEDVYKLLNMQREADMRFRKSFVESHKDNIDSYTESTFTLKNESQKSYGAYIVGIKSQGEEETVFIGRKK